MAAANSTLLPPHQNHLTIAHLLLWTATTAVVLVHQQSQKPRPAESISFDSFMSTPGTDVKAAMAKEQQRIWRGWNNQWLIGLAASPIYGAALAGALLALWRLISLRFRFPTQPGHWLLILICILYWLVAARFFLESLWGTYDGTDLGIALLMAASASVIAFAMWQPLRWSLAVGLAALAFAAMSCAILAVVYSPGIEPLPAFAVAAMLALIFLSSGILLALLNATVDLYEETHYDALHWIGILTLFGVVMHFIFILIFH